MNIIKKASIEAATSEQDAQEIVQPNITTGFETCQDIRIIKEELARLQIEMDKCNHLALKTTVPELSAKYYGKAQHEAIRYWGIRWVLGWEKEIPE